ncbi:MAG: hypothetical protein HY059_05770 [Proteobacteria bacterium]|nr:hypothetical protein [Pseudomonadota bacterium]
MSDRVKLRLLARGDVSRERALNFAMIAAAFVLVLLPERNYVPIWDGRVYANCVIGAAADGFSLETLRCAGHPTQGWALLLALPQMARLGDVALLHLTDIALGILALASIRVVLARVFPAPEHARELDFLTLICAVHPVLLSTLVQPNIDFGVYVFFFAALAALLRGAWAWTAVAGTFLCFSKETGVLAYAVMLGLHALWETAEVEGAVAHRVRVVAARLAKRWVTIIPLVLFGALLAWREATVGASGVWKHQWQQGPLDGFNFFDLSEPTFRSYAAGLFVLGFGWVVSAIVGADGVVGLWRMARRAPSRAVRGADAHRLALLTVLTFVLTYLLTSFRTWSNLRYFALLYPLFLMMMFAALLRLGLGAKTRAAVLGVVGMLFVVAVYRSADPVSRRLYGTFSVGERDMYRMSSITQEYGGAGRDELVYNLQFTGFHHVQNALFRAMQPTDSTAYATPRIARWNIYSQLDARTWRRTMRRSDVIVPRYWDEMDLVSVPSPPREVWWLEFPYAPDPASALAGLSKLYRVTSVMHTTYHGFTLVARRLERITP